MTLASLRRHVSVVQQDPFLFTAAIDNNVNYGDPWAERSAVRRATEAAQLNKYVEQLPEGYETLVEERGVSLSGGQRQRLAIARSVCPLRASSSSTTPPRRSTPPPSARSTRRSRT